ncbi:hypothetical protein OsI_00617 [Oryza sativa Indica Group]|uniref:DYW domain-containing protein n=1 Tax=Oryza sativa subsp. indica TaxID=39946 RepID=A2WLA5_ORYSI|nr:hypothetical protein OsI_00617 [Oryza sativa Indica Group]
MVRALSRARSLLDGIPHRRGRAASSSVSGHGAEEAVAGYVRMLAGGARPDAYTFPSLLKAAAAARGAAAAAASVGGAIHAHVVKFGMESNAHAASSLIVMYAARGDGAAARAVLEAACLATGGGAPVMWNALISGHNRSGRFELSCCSFVDMVRAGAMTTAVTYVSVLSACGKGKDLLLGMQVHKRVLESGVLPDQRVENALVDMYAECGDMDAAWVLFEGMQMRSMASWTSVISGLVRSGQVDRARDLFDHMPERDTIAWTAMIDGYVQVGRFRDALETFRYMQICKVRADEFTMVSVVTACAQLAADRSHPMNKEIYSKLENVLTDLRNAGYVPDVTEVLVEVTEEEKQKVLYWHSEKLAVTFALLTSESNVIIRIVKNLRMCLDCHNAIKLISKLYGREVIVRDRTRFHHFRHGSCSCKDYW